MPGIFNWLVNWRLRRAAQRYARALRPRIVELFGASDTYTRPQIDRTIADLKLPPKFKALGYAECLSRDSYRSAMADASTDRFLDLDFDVACDLLERYRPLAGTWEQASVSNHVHRGGGEQAR